MRFCINKIITIFIFVFICGTAYTQVADINDFRPDLEKEKKYLPYIAVWHGGLDNIEDWKKNNTVLYFKELWYYTESFYIKRNHLPDGAVIDDAMIDVSRWESLRDEEQEKIVLLDGYKDALVLIPGNKLKFKPVR